MKRILSFWNAVFAMVLAGLCSCAGAPKSKAPYVRGGGAKTSGVQFWEGVSTRFRYTLGMPLMGSLMLFAFFGGGAAVPFGTLQDVADYKAKAPE